MAPVKRLNVLLPVVVTLVILAGAGGYWFVRIRERADAATVRAHVLKAYPGATATCVKGTSDGSTWVCGVVYKVESECVALRVSVLGSIATKQGKERCSKLSEIASTAPPPSASRVAADIARLSKLPANQVVCSIAVGSKNRWACVKETAAPSCVLVRVAPWQPWAPTRKDGACRRIPALRHLMH